MALAKNPTVNGVFIPFDSLATTSGGLRAIKDSGLKPYVVGGNGNDPQFIDAIRTGAVTACTSAQDFRWLSYGAMDELNRYFNHHDHREVGWATLDAVAPAASNPHYFPNAGPVHRVSSVYLSATLEPDAWVDIGETIDAKVDALACHKTQLDEAGEWFRGFVRERAEEAGRMAGVTYAEGFRRLTFEG